MEDHERCTITEIAIDGEPISPKKFAKKFVSQCGVVVRDTVPITTQEWKKPVKGGEGVTYVDTRLKSVMFRKLLINFIFPEPTDSDSENDRPDPEDPELNSVQRRVKKWALKKMAVQFNDYKKKLDSFFVKKGKTPDFKGPYEKIKDHWEEFVKLKKSDKAKKRSDTNTKNASNKMYFHTMGRGGYNAGRPKWEKWENELIKKGIQPEIEEVAFDATGQGSQRKSSVASTELPGDDAHVDPQMAPPSPVEPQMDLDLYPVDFITESTPCELHFQTMGYLTLKAAVGYVLPPVPDQRYHFKPVPPGYAVAGVDQVMDGYGPLRLDHPAGEGDLLELGEAKNTTVLWRKEFIVIPGWKAPTRSPPRQHSPPMQPSPVREPSPPAREPSPPTREPSPPPREPSPPPREPSPPPQPKSKSKIRRSATTQLSRNRSPRRKQEPLPRVPKVPPKRPYDYTVEENAKIVAEQHKQQMLKLKKPQLEPEPAISLEKKLKLLKNLHQPEPSLSSNYDRSIRKSNVSARDRWEKSKVEGKPVPQLGNQKNSCPPLQVYPDVTACFDPEMVRLYKDEADAVGMSIPEYLSRIDAEFLTSTGDDVQIAYQYKYGQPLVRAEELPNLSTQLRRLHNWYMEKCKDGKNWIMVAITDEHYGRNDVMNIEFCELFQLFNQDALDKSLLSAYCLMKIRECRKGQIYDLGFVDPYTVNGFHYILLVIEPDTGIVEVMDSKSKPLEAWGDMADILLKAWKRFTNKSPGLKNKELRIKHVPSLCRGSVLVQFPAAAESAAAGKGTKMLPRPNPFAPVRITNRCKSFPAERPTAGHVETPLAPVRNPTGAKGGPFAPDGLHRLAIRCIWPLKIGAKGHVCTSDYWLKTPQAMHHTCATIGNLLCLEEFTVYGKFDSESFLKEVREAFGHALKDHPKRPSLDLHMASSINFNQFLEKEKLKSNGSNFTDWFRHVRIFLNGGNLQYVLDAPLGDPPAETETDEVKNVYMTRKTRYSQVQCAILCSLESDLQKRFEHHDPHELIKELKTIFETHAAVECYEASKHFFSCMMEEGSSISEHMLVMTGHAKKLSDLGIVIPNRLGINRVLQSLPPSYKNFVMNYNMQNMNKEFPELFGMLKAAEIEIKKEHQVLMVNKTTSFKKQGKSKGKNKKSGKKAATPPVKPKSGPKPDAECYYCKEKGHWKRNCSKYLADLKSGLVKKKKEEFLTKEVTGRKVELDEIEESLLVDQSSAVPENVPVPPTPATEEANDNDHETSNETATEPRRSTRDRATPDWYDPCLNVMIVDNNDEDPATYEEAMMSPDSNKWQEAMKSEMGSMYDNKVWTLVDLPDSRKAVENKWIFKRKTDADGNITVYKARLVAKGFRQIQGVDYDETFSPVAKLKSVRILLAIAAFFDYEIWQMDVKTAFLNGDIEEELYMVQPKGFVDPKNADKVCKLQRSIYGLKQASRSWNRRFDKVIKDFGFIQCHGEACIYKKVSGSSVAFLILYVDDILLIGNDIELLSSVKGYLNNSFSMKDLGEASYILGIKIYRDRSRRLIGLSQSTYLDKILKKFRMDESKKGFLPMLPGKVLSKTQGPATAEERERMSQIPYASAVGSIMYAMLCTRPDIAHAVSLTSRYQSDPGMEHWTAVKNILKYLKRTKDMFLCYGGDQELVVTSYTDASWNTDPDDSKSQSGYVFILNGAAVSWASSKQCTVAKSSTESEYIAASGFIRSGMDEEVHCRARCGS
ncbi:hypothetical protein QYE76_003630 [Lolium multiflorum]|uniref:CCHC-type domain-containing protein n=1 Tax=Lolium multiflorum TaxID=4521 RepID=A0AAD8RPN7_LOLMU|nr:hypothetical protein QYE76_003630 [Lolium multiflorum]